MNDNFDFQGEEMNYCVYVHINKINGKLYIGVTNNVNARWKPYAYNHCPKFTEAIQKYGWDNFEHIVLIDNISKEMALICEAELIVKYKTLFKWGNGYNVKLDTILGIHANSIPKHKGITVYQYSVDGDFIRKWDNILQASKETGCLYGYIKRQCEYGDTTNYYEECNYKYQFRLEYHDKIAPLKTVTRSELAIKKTGPFVKVDLNGNILGEYEDVRDYTLERNEMVAIRECLRGNNRTHDGFLWILKDEFSDDLVKKLIAEHNSSHDFCHVPIYQFTLDGKFIKKYDSIAQAAKETGGNMGGISHNANHLSKSSGGFLWSYENVPQEPYVDNHLRKVVQINKDTNEIIGFFKTIKDVSIYMNKKKASIGRCLNGKTSTAYGYKWEYYNPDKHDISHLEIQ